MNDIKEGYGVYTFENGAKYKGEFKNNVQHGKGIYVSPEGVETEGIWVNGQKKEEV
jgi:hypothetical protein